MAVGFCRISEGNLHLSAFIKIGIWEQVDLSVRTCLGRGELHFITIHQHFECAFREKQELSARSSLHQILDIGEVGHVNANSISIEECLEVLNRALTTQVDTEVNVVEIEFCATITRLPTSVCIITLSTIIQVKCDALEIINTNFSTPAILFPLSTNSEFINEATSPLTWLCLCTCSNRHFTISLD